MTRQEFMITIIHGSDQSATRNALAELRTKYKETVILDGKNLALSDLQLALESQSLFGEEKIVVVENYFNGRKNRDDVLNYLLHQPNVSLVFWEDKESKSKDLSKISGKSTKVLVYNLPIVIFRFLDSFYPGNSKNCLNLFREALNQNEPEMLNYMLVKQIRYMLLSLPDNNSTPEVPTDFKRLATWQIAKLNKQANFFGTERLQNLYNNLEQIEYEQKSGKTNVDTETMLGLFILNVL